MKYYQRKLKNGLTIVEVPSEDAESVVVDFFVKTGSRSETAKENGISHFLEHFLFKGTKKFPTTMAITELVDGIGGEMNANTGKEHTQYFIKAHHNYLQMIFEVLTDMIQNPLLDKTEMEREKGVIVEEINMYKDSTRVTASNVLEELMWPGDSLGRDIAGQVDIVTKFNRKMFESYLTRHYQTGNIILGISGKYDRAKLNKLINKYWSKVPSKKFDVWKKAKDNQNAWRIKLEYKDIKQPVINFGFKGLDYNHKDNITAAVLASVLGGGMSSRLFTEVRERRGLAYYVRASNANFQDTGVFDVSSGVRLEAIEDAMRVILDELKKIASEPITEKELAKAKAYLKGKTTLALEDNQMRLDWFLEEVAFKKKVQTPQEIFKAVDKVTINDVLKLAKQLFVSQKMSLAVVGPYKSTKKFEQILKEF
jgi:predicted Zn-dependent peptidase